MAIGSWRQYAFPGESYDQVVARQQRIGDMLQPYNQAIARAGAGAQSAALTAGAMGGSPFAAQRHATQAAIDARAPLIGQRAAAEASAIQREQDAFRAMQEQRRQEGLRFLGAGLQAGGAVLGTILPGLGSIGGGAASTLGGMATQHAQQQVAQASPAAPASTLGGMATPGPGTLGGAMALGNPATGAPGPTPPGMRWDPTTRQWVSV